MKDTEDDTFNTVEIAVVFSTIIFGEDDKAPENILTFLQKLLSCVIILHTLEAILTNTSVHKTESNLSLIVDVFCSLIKKTTSLRKILRHEW